MITCRVIGVGCVDDKTIRRVFIHPNYQVYTLQLAYQHRNKALGRRSWISYCQFIISNFIVYFHHHDYCQLDSQQQVDSCVSTLDLISILVSVPNLNCDCQTIVWVLWLSCHRRNQKRLWWAHFLYDENLLIIPYSMIRLLFCDQTKSKHEYHLHDIVEWC